jgi:hypothetical protein
LKHLKRLNKEKLNNEHSFKKQPSSINNKGSSTVVCLCLYRLSSLNRTSTSVCDIVSIPKNNRRGPINSDQSVHNLRDGMSFLLLPIEQLIQTLTCMVLHFPSFSKNVPHMLCWVQSRPRENMHSYILEELWGDPGPEWPVHNAGSHVEQ